MVKRELRTRLVRIRAVASILSATYWDFAHYNRRNPLDELLFILMSVLTREQSYRRTYKSFRRAFPQLKMLHEASVEEIARAIEKAGLANRRSRIIKDIIESLVAKFGKPTLAPLAKMGDEDAEQLLTSLPGVGRKVARCVLMYSLGRAVFPVDGHCWRVAYRLGWVSWKTSASGPNDGDMDKLQDLIPPDKRFSLHVNMVSHGRKVCTAQNPKCWGCRLKDRCPKIGVKHGPFYAKS